MEEAAEEAEVEAKWEEAVEAEVVEEEEDEEEATEATEAAEEATPEQAREPARTATEAGEGAMSILHLLGLPRVHEHLRQDDAIHRRAQCIRPQHGGAAPLLHSGEDTRHASRAHQHLRPGPAIK